MSICFCTDSPLSSATSAVTLTRRYDAYGNIEVGASTGGYAFTGREWDPETGLYYYRARYYDPKIGRFISEDQIGLEGAVNFYGYVRGNPVSSIDPFGLVDLNLFKEDPLRAAADKFNSPSGVFTVGGHGNPRAMLDEYTGRRVTPAELAARIRASKAWSRGKKTVWLLGCNVGTGTDSFAQLLADELGVPVVGASGGRVWYDESSTSQYGPFQPNPYEGGAWKPFAPRTSAGTPTRP